MCHHHRRGMMCDWSMDHGPTPIDAMWKQAGILVIRWKKQTVTFEADKVRG